MWLGTCDDKGNVASKSFGKGIKQVGNTGTAKQQK